MTRVPTRGWLLVLAAALKLTPPLPKPLAPAVMVSHPALDDAVQAQSVALAVTAVLPLPPAAATLPPPGVNEKLQAVPGCVIVKVWPAIDSDPLRAWLLVFALAV